MDVDCNGPSSARRRRGATTPLVASTRADDRRSSSGGSSPPLCAEGGSCTEQRSTEPEDRQSKWGAPWRPEGARGAAGGSHGRLCGCQYSSPGGGVAGWRRRCGRHHRLLPPLCCAREEERGGGEGEGEGGEEERMAQAVAGKPEFPRLEEWLTKRRRKKKRRKWRLPRASSYSSRAAALTVDTGSGQLLAGFLVLTLPTLCFPSSVGTLELPGIMVGLDQDASFLRARRRLRQLHMLGWFGWLLLALCSLLLSTGPRCSASWPVWTRRKVLRYFPAAACARLVLLVILHLALYSLLLSSGPRCSASWLVRTRRTVAKGLWFRLQKTEESPQLQFIAGHRHPVRTAEAESLWSRLFSRS